MADDAELLTSDELAAYIKRPKKTLERWRQSSPRSGPAWITVGRTVRYRREDVDAWLEANRVEPEPSRRTA